MARLYTGGFEFGHQQPEGLTRTGAAAGLSFATDKARTGSRSLKLAAGTAVTNYLTRLQAGTSGRRYWSRCYIWLPSGTISVVHMIVEVYCTSTATWADLEITTGGLLRFNTSAGGGASYGAIPRDQWVMVEFGVTVNTASNDTFDVYMNGVQQNGALSIAWSTTNITGWNFGNDGAAASTVDMWFDDIAINDDQGSSQTTRPGEGKVAYLMPVAAGSTGTNEANWTKPGGSTTSKWTSVDNVPPVFAADSAVAGAAESFLRDATASADDLTLACTDYTTAGIGASDTITLVQAMALLGSSSTTANAGTLAMQANPAITGVAAAFPVAVASATATTWTRRDTSVAYAPSVTKGTQPQIRLSRAATSSGTKMVDAMAVIVEYVLVTDTTPPTTDASVTATRMSRVAGKDAVDVTITADENFVEFDVRVVPSSGSTHTAGTSIETAAVGARTSHTITITDDEYIAASGGAGTFIVKAFTKDAAGNWST